MSIGIFFEFAKLYFYPWHRHLLLPHGQETKPLNQNKRQDGKDHRLSKSAKSTARLLTFIRSEHPQIAP